MRHQAPPQVTPFILAHLAQGLLATESLLGGVAACALRRATREDIHPNGDTSAQWLTYGRRRLLPLTRPAGTAAIVRFSVPLQHPWGRLYDLPFSRPNGQITRTAFDHGAAVRRSHASPAPRLRNPGELLSYDLTARRLWLYGLRERVETFPVVTFVDKQTHAEWSSEIVFPGTLPDRPEVYRRTATGRYRVYAPDPLLVPPSDRASCAELDPVREVLIAVSEAVVSQVAITREYLALATGANAVPMCPVTKTSTLAAKQESFQSFRLVGHTCFELIGRDSRRLEHHCYPTSTGDRCAGCDLEANHYRHVGGGQWRFDDEPVEYLIDSGGLLRQRPPDG